MEIVNPYVDNLRKLLCCLLASVRGTTGIEDTKTRPYWWRLRPQRIAIARLEVCRGHNRGNKCLGMLEAAGGGFSCCEMPALHSAFFIAMRPSIGTSSEGYCPGSISAKEHLRRRGEAKGEARRSELQYDPPGTHHPGEARGDTQEGADRGLGRGIHCAVERGKDGTVTLVDRKKRLDLRMSSSFKVGLGDEECDCLKRWRIGQ